MQIIPINIAPMMTLNTVWGYATIQKATDINGNQFTLGTGNNINAYPFYVGDYNQDITPSTTQATYLKCFASSNTNITETSYIPSDIIGISTVRYAPTSKGWVATIAVAGTEGDTINALLFQRGLYNGSTYKQAVIFAVILDNPITIDSTGTAYFTFAIEFD